MWLTEVIAAIQCLAASLARHISDPTDYLIKVVRANYVIH